MIRILRGSLSKSDLELMSYDFEQLIEKYCSPCFSEYGHNLPCECIECPYYKVVMDYNNCLRFLEREMRQVPYSHHD